MTRSLDSTASDWVARRDAGLTPAEEAQFQSWLAHPDHARAYARHERTFRIFQLPARSGQGESTAREIRARVTRRRRRRIISTASVLAVLFLGAWLWQRHPTLSDAPPSNALVIRPETRVLPDGSVVELKAGAKIAVDYDHGPRRVALLQGEAHFQVAKNPDRPFLVLVDQISVRAVGTAFAVDRTTKSVEVLVTEGRVAIDQVSTAPIPTGGTSPAPSPATLALLGVGDRTIVNLDAIAAAPAVEALAESDLNQRLAWRTPRLEFSATPLPEAIRLLNEFNTVKFEIADESLNAVEVTGYFRAGNPDAFLVLLENGFSIRGERSGDTIKLRKAR